MARRLKVSASKPDDPSFIPRTLGVEEENHQLLLQVLLESPDFHEQHFCVCPLPVSVIILKIFMNTAKRLSGESLRHLGHSWARKADWSIQQNKRNATLTRG